MVNSSCVKKSSKSERSFLSYAPGQTNRQADKIPKCIALTLTSSQGAKVNIWCLVSHIISMKQFFIYTCSIFLRVTMFTPYNIWC